MNIVRPTNEYNYYSVNYSIPEYPKCPIAVFNGTRLGIDSHFMATPTGIFAPPTNVINAKKCLGLLRLVLFSLPSSQGYSVSLCHDYTMCSCALFNKFLYLCCVKRECKSNACKLFHLQLTALHTFLDFF